MYNFNSSSAKMAYRAGSDHGLFILLQGNQKDYMCTTQTAGFKILIHNATERPFVDTQGYMIAPGTSSMISIKQVYRESGEVMVQ